MVRISKKRLPEEYYLRINQLFFEIVARATTKTDFYSIIDDLLSPTEKIMIGKRIGLIYLLIKGIDQRTIAHTLNLSTCTVAKFSLLFHNKETSITKLINRMIVKEKVLGFLDDLFSEIFTQPGIYKGHYQRQWEHKLRKEKRELL